MIHAVDLRLRLLVAGDAALPVPASFRYDPDDPFAVHATFHAAGDTVEWVFARELLYGGLTNDMGSGDVRVWPSTDSGVPVMYISLRSPEGDALLELPIPDVQGFLQFTYRMVPAGNESDRVRIDDVLAKILDES